MARCPFATFIGPTPNKTPGGMRRPFLGLVLHIQRTDARGSEGGSESWLKNPASQASAHFLVTKAGELRQLVDLDDKAWAEAAGNPRWVSVEIDGYAGETMTAAQVAAVARLFRWLHDTEGVELRLSDQPDVGGLGWHGMGGAAWGGHIGCPGPLIVLQRPEILAAAKAGSTPPAPAPGPPEPVTHRFEESAVSIRTAEITVDITAAGHPFEGNGWFQWDTGEPVNNCQATLVGPYPQDDGYWLATATATVRAQRRGNTVVVTVSNAPPGAKVPVEVLAV